ncbi:hypothetical protein ZIOFF_070052 [Zingiber officinale]|uniref:protein-serine/threonine phosphatase n=1 Tax=Zingiber officinale TaxID=94328 RepID=A0A8J5CWF1_ZINOF|nr:hypothetical protein ZIOFF_070052 [Zingiber officinale]
MGSCLSSTRPSPVSDGTLTGSYDGKDRFGSRSWGGRRMAGREKHKWAGGARRGGVADGAGRTDEDELQGAPGRMSSNGASEAACLYTQQGRKGTNQDAMIVWEVYLFWSSRDSSFVRFGRHFLLNTVFCGVFDGHGPYGHMVSKKVRDSLPLKFCTSWRASLTNHDSPDLNGSISGSMNSEETVSIIDDDGRDAVDDENEKLPEIYLPLKQSFLKSFKLMDKELLAAKFITLCSTHQGQDLVIGNIGDSRAIMGTRDKDNNLVAMQLTVDLKPNLPNMVSPGEAARIQQCKGRVFALQDEPEVARVWLPNNDSPGLAMARAFGDFCLKDYGLISVPEISYHRLTEKDEFIVLATDGVWDVLSNKEVVDIVASAPSHSTASRAIVDCAVRAWRLKYPTSKVDDCAVVCLFLESISSSDPAQILNPEKVYTEPPATAMGSINEKQMEGKQEMQDFTSPDAPTVLGPSYHVIEVDETVRVTEQVESMPERSQSIRSLADCISTREEEWSALEGVSRVNSLVNLPRFSAGERSSMSWKNWL